MTGKSHLFMGTAAMAGAFGMGCLMESEYAPGFCHIAADYAKGFLFDGGPLPMPVFVPCMMALFLLGCLVPDMDSDRSLLGRHIHIPVKHRTWMHTAYLVLLFLIPGIFVRPLFWLGLGIYWHLLCDSPSNWGVDWFYPKRNWHHLKLYETGDVTEYIVVGILASLLFFLCGFGIWVRFFL